MEYTPRRKDKMEREPECFRLDAFPEVPDPDHPRSLCQIHNTRPVMSKEHVKKVTLLKHFQNYLVTHDTVEGFLPLAASPTGWKTRPQGKSIPFVKKWLKTRHAIVFRLSTRLVQVRFLGLSLTVPLFLKGPDYRSTFSTTPLSCSRSTPMTLVTSISSIAARCNRSELARRRPPRIWRNGSNMHVRYCATSRLAANLPSPSQA